MADLENPDGGGETVAAAEPAECSRYMFMCMLGFVGIALFFVFAVTTMDPKFQESHTITTNVAAFLLGLLAGVVGLWSLAVLTLLHGEWYDGNPEGQRMVDSLLHSNHPLQDSIHQFLHRLQEQPVDA